MFHPSIIEPETYKTLKTIFEFDEIRENYALAGGTALALQLHHRSSVDLDIFSPSPINTEHLSLNLSASNQILFRHVNSNKNMLFSYINSVKCDFIFEPAKLIRPFIIEDGINYFSIEDIAAMKMHTVCGRGKKKDFFDIYALLQKEGWKNMLQWFEEKYGQSQFYFLWRSITYFKDADKDPEINGIYPYTKKWNEIKKFIKEKCV